MRAALSIQAWIGFRPIPGGVRVMNPPSSCANGGSAGGSLCATAGPFGYVSAGRGEVSKVDSAGLVDPRRGSELLRNWFTARDSDSVDFTEEFDPEIDRNDDYVVAYEARFSPEDLRRARVEVWITEKGLVAFGFEKETRVGMRVGKRVRGDSFATGMEPAGVSEKELISLLNLSAEGRIGLLATVLPVFGVVSVRALVADGTKQGIGLVSSAFDWLHEETGNASTFGKRVNYEPW